MVTVKISEDARTLLRLLAAHKKKRMHEVAEDLCWAEAKKMKLSIRGVVEKNNDRKRVR
jgi:hypothetical protein